MNTGDIRHTLTTLLAELVDGAPKSGAFILNRGDPGLLRSLDRVSASAASTSPTGGASISAHTDHLRYSLSLLNRWSAGEEPFAAADWSASWLRMTVTPEEWDDRREELRSEAHQWLAALAQPRDVSDEELDAIVASIAHVAYHLGAIRQIDQAARGPREGG